MDNKNLDIKNIFSLAYQNHIKNNFKLAESLYKKVLKINNNHLETNFFFGYVIFTKEKFRSSNFVIK